MVHVVADFLYCVALELNKTWKVLPLEWTLKLDHYRELDMEISGCGQGLIKEAAMFPTNEHVYKIVKE